MNDGNSRSNTSIDFLLKLIGRRHDVHTSRRSFALPDVTSFGLVHFPFAFSASWTSRLIASARLGMSGCRRRQSSMLFRKDCETRICRVESLGSSVGLIMSCIIPVMYVM